MPVRYREAATDRIDSHRRKSRVLPESAKMAALVGATGRRRANSSRGITTEGRRRSGPSVVIGGCQPQDSSDGSSQLSYDSSIEPSSP